MKRIRWRYSTRARIGWVVVAALLAITLSRAVASGLSARLIVNIGLLAAVAVAFAAVSRVMTDPERILAPELWESLEQLPSRDGKTFTVIAIACTATRHLNFEVVGLRS
jgi:hypothetical protein